MKKKLKSLIQTKKNDFKEKIEEKFKQKRDERIKYLGERPGARN